MLIEGRDIKKTFGNKFNKTEVLKGIDFNLEEGEYVAIMGPSGSGKTTFLNVISTIDHMSDGFLTIAGQDMLKLKDKNLAEFRKTSLGFIFQEYNLLDTLTVKENILLPMSIRNVSKAEAENRFKEIAEALDIYALKDKYPYQISGGQGQRTSAARAFIHQPKIIFADEPTGALDSKSATTMLELLKQYNESSGTSIMMVTHDATAASYSDRTVFLKDGQIYTSLSRGDASQTEYYQKILNTTRILGGVKSEA